VPPVNNKDRKCIYTSKKNSNLGNPALNQKHKSHYFEQPMKGEPIYGKEKKKYTDLVLCFPRRKEADSQKDD